MSLLRHHRFLLVTRGFLFFRARKLRKLSSFRFFQLPFQPRRFSLLQLLIERCVFVGGWGVWCWTINVSFFLQGIGPLKLSRCCRFPSAAVASSWTQIFFTATLSMILLFFCFVTSPSCAKLHSGVALPRTGLNFPLNDLEPPVVFPRFPLNFDRCRTLAACLYG